MFEFIKSSNLALDDLAKKDKKYKPIINQLKTLLSEIKGEFLTFDKAHIKTEQTINESHILIKDTFNEKINLLNKNLDDYSKDIDQKIGQVQQDHRHQIQQNSDEILAQIEDIRHKITEYQAQFETQKSKALTIRSKEISDIDKVIANIKKQSALSIEKLENNHQKDLENLMNKFRADEQLILDASKVASEKIEVDINQIEETKNLYREQSDKKYVSIKSDYHEASIAFNKAVDKLKKNKELALKKLAENDEQNKQPIEDALVQLKADYEHQKATTAQLYKDKLEAHKQLIHELTQNYNQEKEKLIQAHGDAISLINSKLSSFRDVVASDRIERANQLKIDIENAANEDEIKTLKRSLQKHLRQQENELNRQIIRTEKESQTLLKTHYENLQLLETKYLEAKSKWRIDGKQLVVDQKLTQYIQEQNFQYQLKSLQLQLKTLKATNEFELDRIDIKHLKEIAPLDLKLSIANAISEKDVNLLSNDTNYHLNHYQHQADTLNHDYAVKKLTFDHDLEVLNITKDHDLSVLNMRLQLSIDKEMVIRDQQLSNQQLKKDFQQLTYDKTIATESLLLQKEIALCENDITHLEKLIRSHEHFLSDKSIVEQSLLKHQLTIEETTTHYQERIQSVEMTQEMLKKDLEVIHSRIHYLFNQIYLIYNIHHNFMMALIEIYEIPAHPEDVKQFIQLYLEIFNHLNEIQEHAKNQFLVDLNTFQELKINDLSALKSKTDMNLLESEFLSKIKHLEHDIQTNEQAIHQIEERIMVLSSNVDRIQSNINNLDPNLDAKQLQDQKTKYNQQINAVESEISFLDKSILVHERQIQKLNKRKNKLDVTLETKRLKMTRKNEQEAKSYLKQKYFYIQSSKRITQLFETYEEKVLQLTTKVNQPLYLTDKAIKDYQRNFMKAEDYFEKTSNLIYQSLLKGSVKLFDQLIGQQNSSKQGFLKEEKLLKKKLDKQQKVLENKLKDMTTEFKHRLVLLDNEKQTLVKNIHALQFKDQEQALANQQKELQATEAKIMTTESYLNKEILLIDDNLKSVIEQMHDDFNKQVSKLKLAHNKNIEKLVEQLDVKVKNLKALEESTQLKNNQLSTKFNQTEIRLIESNKQKLQEYEQTLHKKETALNKKIQGIAKQLKVAQTKKDAAIAKQQRKLSRFSEKIFRHEKKLLTNDLKDAQRSYSFKQRTLKLK
ncbi:MAG TPA: hypothetical protein GX698_03405 [Acholeplasmataceae bacterium]|nr:hypothetical protein [Acholeplasmataceae bacterium]